MNGNQIQCSQTNTGQSAFEQAVQDALGTLEGDIDFNGYQGYNLGVPTQQTNIATKGYVDAQLGGGGAVAYQIVSPDGNTLVQAQLNQVTTNQKINMQGNKIINLGAPTSAQDGVNKLYSDNQDAITLQQANTYSDAQDALTLQSAKNYTNNRKINLNNDTEDLLPLNKLNYTTRIAGNLDMNGYFSYNHPDPNLPTESTNKRYVDAQDAAILAQANSKKIDLNNDTQGLLPLNKLDYSTRAIGNLDMNGNFVYNIPDPILPTETGNKRYIDAQDALIQQSINNKKTDLNNDTIGLLPLNKLDYTTRIAGNLDMNGYFSYNHPDPIIETESTNKRYVDAKDEEIKALINTAAGKPVNQLPLATGDLDMNNHRVVNVLDPINPKDVSTKSYTDAKVNAYIPNKISDSLQNSQMYCSSLAGGGIFPEMQIKQVFGDNPCALNMGGGIIKSMGDGLIESDGATLGNITEGLKNYSTNKILLNAVGGSGKAEIKSGQGEGIIVYPFALDMSNCSINMNNLSIYNVGDPQTDTHATKKSYVDNADNLRYLNTTPLNAITLATADISTNSHKITNGLPATSNTDFTTLQNRIDQFAQPSSLLSYSQSLTPILPNQIPSKAYVDNLISTNVPTFVSTVQDKVSPANNILTASATDFQITTSGVTSTTSINALNSQPAILNTAGITIGQSSTANINVSSSAVTLNQPIRETATNVKHIMSAPNTYVANSGNFTGQGLNAITGVLPILQQANANGVLSNDTAVATGWDLNQLGLSKVSITTPFNLLQGATGNLSLNTNKITGLANGSAFPVGGNPAAQSGDAASMSNRITQFNKPQEPLDLNTQRVINLAPPIAGTDAVNRDYVTSVVPVVDSSKIRSVTGNTLVSTSDTGNLIQFANASLQTMNLDGTSLRPLVPIDMGGTRKITGLSAGVANSDAVNLQQLNSTIQNAATSNPCPVGEIIAFFSNTIPSGWLLCSGQTFSQSTYPDLYAFLGNSNVTPDLRGYTLRGLDVTGTVDPNGVGRTIGSVQLDDFKNHQHQFGGDDGIATQGGYTVVSNFTYDATSTNASGTSFNMRTKNDTTNFGGLETRGKNKAVNWLIRAVNQQVVITQSGASTIQIADATNATTLTATSTALLANNVQIKTVADPTQNQDVATKNYVDINHTSISTPSGFTSISVDDTNNIIIKGNKASSAQQLMVIRPYTVNQNYGEIQTGGLYNTSTVSPAVLSLQVPNYQWQSSLGANIIANYISQFSGGSVQSINFMDATNLLNQRAFMLHNVDGLPANNGHYLQTGTNNVTLTQQDFGSSGAQLLLNYTESSSVLRYNSTIAAGTSSTYFSNKQTVPSITYTDNNYFTRLPLTATQYQIPCYTASNQLTWSTVQVTPTQTGIIIPNGGTLFTPTIALTSGATNSFIAVSNPMVISDTGTYSQIFTANYGQLNNTNIMGAQRFTTNSASTPVSLRTSNAIMCGTTVNALSSRNIKNIRKPFDYEAVKDKFQNLRFYDYGYKDLTNKCQENYGIIAEELQEIFPDWVSDDKSYIPNVMRYYQPSNEFIVVELDKPFSKTGKIKVLIDGVFDYFDYQAEEGVAVIQIRSKNKVFVYGTNESCPFVAKLQLFELTSAIVQNLMVENQNLNERLNKIESVLSELQKHVTIN